MLQKLSTLFGTMNTHDFPKSENIFKVGNISKTYVIQLLTLELATLAD